MSHSKEMNVQVYQAPQALMEVTQIGKKLLSIDKPKLCLLLQFSKNLKQTLLEIKTNYISTVLNRI